MADGQELENLLIRVDSELGDLGGIDSAVKALEGLRDFTGDARKGAEALKDMAIALSEIDKFGKTSSGIKKAEENIGKLTSILDTLSKYTGKAYEGIQQLNALGKALHSFANLGTELKGLESAVGSINGVIDCLVRLNALGSGIGKTTGSIKDLTKSFNTATLKKSEQSLKASEESLKSYSKARKDFWRLMKAQKNVDAGEIPLPNIKLKEKELDDIQKEYQKVQDRLKKAYQTRDFAKKGSLGNADELIKKSEEEIKELEAVGKEMASKIADIQNLIRGAYEVNSDVRKGSMSAGLFADNKNLEKAVSERADLLRKVAETMNALSKYNIGDLSKRTEQGFFFDSKSGLQSSIGTSQEAKSISGELKAHLYETVKGMVDTWVHSHPSDMASFSPADINSAFKWIEEGINQVVVTGLKEVSVFYSSAIKEADREFLKNAFNKETIRNYFDKTVTVDFAKFGSIFDVQLYSKLQEGFQQGFGDFLNVSGDEFKNRIISYLHGIKASDMVSVESLTNGLMDSVSDVFKNYSFRDSSMKKDVQENINKELNYQMKYILSEYIHEAMGNASGATINGGSNDVYQGVIKNFLKSLLTSKGYNADEIYKSMPVEEFLNKLNGMAKGVEADNENLRKAFENRRGIIEKAPMPKSSKFTLGGEKEKGGLFGFEEGGFEKSIKMLNDFREAVEKFEGLGEKLSGLKDTVKSVMSMVDVLKILSEYEGKASDSIYQLMELGKALQEFSSLGTNLEGLDKIYKGVTKMIDALTLISEYKGKATSSITQFGNLGKALQEFSDLGKHLEGLESIYKGIAKMVEILEKLKNFEGSARNGITQLANLAKALHAFNGLDAGVGQLNEISIGLLNIGKATAQLTGAQKSDFDYIKHIADNVAYFNGLMTGRMFANVAQISVGLGQLVTALAQTKEINVGSIEAIGTAIKNTFANAEYLKSAGSITGSLNALSKAYEKIGINGSSVEAIMSKLVSGFANASNALYDVRQNIEIISQDFTDALEPVTNSALFDTLKEFKQLNDSYKNVAGLGQGLGQLLQALNDTRFKATAKDSFIAPLRNLLNALENLANEKNIDALSAKFEKLGNLAKPIASLMNALKYTDLKSDNNSLDVLATKIKEFYEKLPTEERFQKVSFTLNAIKDLVDMLKGNTLQINPDDNILTQIAQSMKGFGNLVLPNLAGFVQEIKELVQFLSSLPQDFNLNTKPIKDLLEALTYEDKIDKQANVLLQTLHSISGLAKIDTSNFDGITDTINKLFEGIKQLPSDGLEKLNKINATRLRDLAQATQALANLKDIDPNQLNLIADGLARILNALGGIQGSGNNIKIVLDSQGVTRFQEKVVQTHKDWESFEETLKTGLEGLDFTRLFNFDAPLRDLKKQLRQAEKTYQATERKIEEIRSRMVKSAARWENPREFQTYQGQKADLEREAEKARQYADVIERLKVAIASYKGFDYKNDVDAMQHIKSMREELEKLEKFMKDFKDGAKNADPASALGQGFGYVADRIEYLKEAIRDTEEELNSELERVGESIEAVGYKASEFYDEITRKAEEASEANRELAQSIGSGFSEFGGMLRGSGSKFLGSIGNLTDMFGKAVGNGTAQLTTGTLNSLSSVAKVLGTTTKAIGQIGAVISVVVTAFQAWWNMMTKVEKALTDFIKKCVQFAKTMLSTVVGAFNAVAGAVGKLVSAVKSGAEILASALRKVKEVGESVKNIFASLGGLIAPAVKGMKSLLSLAVPNFVKKIASANGSLKNIVKNTVLLKKAISVVTRYFSMWSRMLMRKSITAFMNKIKQAFEDLAVFEKNAGDEALVFNRRVSEIFSALRVSANQWMGAFEPMINAITPIVLNVIHKLTALGENLAIFMAKLTGQSYYIRAKDIYEDYAESIEEANKKQKDLTNGLDELNILSDKKDEGGLSPEDMFEKVPIDGALDLPDISDILDKFKDWLDSIDWDAIKDNVRKFINRLMDIINQILRDKELWYKLGNYLAEIFNTIMTAWNQFILDFDPVATAQALAQLIIGALTNIDWELIRENIKLTARKFAEFWNDIFANEELWDAIVSTIDNLLNAIVDYFNTWAWTFDFSQMAQQLTDSIKEVLQGFNWEGLSSAVEGWVTGIVDFINTAVANKDAWEEFGQSIAKIVNIIIEAFDKLGDINLADAVDSLNLAIKSFLENIKWEEFFNAVQKWAENIADAINALLTDTQTLTDITTSIANFINGIINLFDEALIRLQGYDIGTAIANALITGLETVQWNTLFMLPADAINKLTEALQGLIDSVPEDFNLGTWLAEHLNLTMEIIDWDAIKKVVEDFATEVSDYVNGLLEDKDFWENLGKTAGRTINLLWDLTIKPLANINFDELIDSIETALSNALKEINIEEKMGELGGLTQKIIDAIDRALKKTDWKSIGEEIGRGITAYLQQINVNSIATTIYNAIVALSDTIGGIVSQMIIGGDFYKLGLIIANAVYGMITGLAYTLTTNKTKFVQAIEQLTQGIIDFIKANKASIISAVNAIINGIVDILSGVSRQKAELVAQLADILEKSNIAKLIGAIIGLALQKLAESAELKDAIWSAIVNNLGGLIEGVFAQITPASFLKLIVRGLVKGLMTLLVKALMTWAWAGVGGIIGGLAGPVGAILGFLLGMILDQILEQLNVYDIIVDKISGLFNWDKTKKSSTSQEDIQKQIEEAMKALDGLDAIEDKKYTPTYTIDPKFEFGDYDTSEWDEYFKQRQQGVIIDDPEFGTITAKKIEIETLKPLSIDTEVIYAKTIEVGDILGDKLKVKTIEAENGAGVLGARRMDEYYAPNEQNGIGGVLARDGSFDKIVARILEITEKITAPLLEIAEKITTELIEAKKITTELLEAKKITTDLLEAKKITTDLLEAKKIITDLLEAKKIKTDLLDAKKIKTDLLEAMKIVTQLFEATQINTGSVNASTFVIPQISAGSLNVSSINASTISASLLNVSGITAGTLKVGTIEGSIGGLIGGTIGGSGYSFTTPTFNKGERFSDLTGLVPSAEDFFNTSSSVGSFVDIISQYISDGINSAFSDGQAVLGARREQPAGTSDIDLPDNAQYIKDYLMSFIGNEAGVYGLMGNLYAESNLRSNNLQDTANSRLGMTDEEYTDYINNGGKFTDNNGYGLAQWTTSDRKNNLMQFLNGRSVDDLDAQLEYLKYELENNYSGVLDTLKNASSIHEASTAVLTGFEKPNNATQYDALRQHYGEGIARLLGMNENTEEDEDSGAVLSPFDEANVLGDKRESNNPADLLSTLFDYALAKIYDVIDTWLGRILKLVDAFMKKLYDYFKNLYDYISVLSALLPVNFKIDLDAEFDGLSDKLKEELDKCMAFIDDFVAKAKKKFREVFDEFKATLDGELKVTAEANADANAWAWSEAFAESLEKSLDKVVDSINGIGGKIDTIVSGNNPTVIADIGKSIDRFGETVKSAIGNITCVCTCDKDSPAVLGDKRDPIAIDSTDIVNAIGNAKDTIANGIQDVIKSTTPSGTSNADIISAIKEAKNAIVEAINNAKSAIVSKLESLNNEQKDLSNIINAIKETKDAIVSKLDELKREDNKENDFSNIINAIKDAKSAIVEKLNNLLNQEKKANDNSEITKAINDAKSAIVSKLDNLADKFKDEAKDTSDIVDAIKSAKSDIVGEIKNLANQQAKELDTSKMVDAVNNAKTAIVNEIKNLENVERKENDNSEVVKAVNSAKSAIVDEIKKLEQVEKKAIDVSSVKKAVDSAKSSIVSAINKLLQQEKKSVDVSAVTKAVNNAKTAIVNAINKLEKAEKKAVDVSSVTKAVNSAKSAIVNEIKKLEKAEKKAVDVSSVKKAVDSAKSSIVSAINKLAKQEKKAVDVSPVTKAVNNAKTAIVNAINKLLNVEKKSVDVSSVTKAVDKAKTAIVNEIKKLANVEKKSIDVSSITKGIKDAKTAIVNAIKALQNTQKKNIDTSSITKAIKDAKSSIVKEVQKLSKADNDTLKAIKEAKEAIVKAIKNIKSGEASKTNLESVTKKIAETKDAIIKELEKIYKILEKILKAIQDAQKAIVDAVKNIKGTSTTASGGDVVKAIKEAKEAIVNAIKNIKLGDIDGSNIKVDLSSVMSSLTRIQELLEWVGNKIGDIKCTCNCNCGNGSGSGNGTGTGTNTGNNNDNKKNVEPADPNHNASTDTNNSSNNGSGEKNDKDSPDSTGIPTSGSSSDKVSMSDIGMWVGSKYSGKSNAILDNFEGWKNWKQDVLATAVNSADSQLNNPKATTIRFFDKDGNKITDEATLKAIKEYLINTYGITAKETASSNNSNVVATDTANTQADKTTTAKLDQEAYKNKLEQGIEDGLPVLVGRGDGTGQVSSEDRPYDLSKFVNADEIESIAVGNNMTSDKTSIITLFEKWYDRFKVKGYQMGGFPKSGEVFLSRENGTPEFVGSLGNRTVVANNDQIVTAVANGVSMANDRVVNAIEQQTASVETAIERKDMNVSIGDRQIAEANRRGQQDLGKKFVD